MSFVRALTVLSVLFLATREACAENVISWDSSPKVTMAGVEIAGSVSLDSGWTPASFATVRYWISGKLVTEYYPFVSCNKWSATLTAIPAGAYNVVVELVVENLMTCEEEKIATATESFTVS
jgi:hypothetical protein